MAPSTRLRPVFTRLSSASQSQYVCQRCQRASMATVTVPAPSTEQIIYQPSTIVRHPATQPPSIKPPEFRKSQLHRQYQSMLNATPLIVIFQHNNLKSNEWIGIKRELANALRKVDEERAKDGDMSFIGQSTKLQVVQTGILASALRVIEFWTPRFGDLKDPNMPIQKPHGLSKQAWKAGRRKDKQHGLEALLCGPLALLQLPTVSLQHLKAALSILSPAKDIPAPKRKANPTYHEPAVQNGLAKLMLLGARVDGQIFDFERARWVASIEGGLGGLHAQLVHILQSAGSSLTTTLDSAGKSLYMTVESRRTMLEEGDKSEGDSPS